MDKNYRILLYYMFNNIGNPEEFTKNHLALCKELNLKGRILISHEGVNGTCSGTVENTKRYMEALRSLPGFENTVFKIDESEGHAFNRLKVKHRSILTLLPEDEVNPNDKVGTYLKPKEFYEMLQRDDVIVVDGRNDDCHHQFICCESCEKTHSGFCSTACSDYVIKKPERDAITRLKHKKAMYERYNQNHDMYKRAIDRLEK